MIAPTKLPLVLTLVLVVSAFGQKPDERVVLWGGDAACGYRGTGLSPDEKISCTSLQTPRGPLSVIHHDGLSLAIGFLEDKDRIVVAALLKNSTTETIQFDTDLWGAAHFRTVQGFYAGDKAIVAETAIPSRDIVRGVMSGITLDNSADVFMAGIAKASEVREIRRPDGTRVKKVVIVDDPDAQIGAASRGDSRAQIAGDELEKIRETALTQKWVAAQNSVKGLVYFRRVKKAGLVVFNFRIGDTLYIFRYPRNKSGSP